MAITDAKVQLGLPVGAFGVKEADGTAATIRYAPVGPNLITNSGAESDTTGWTLANGATLTRDTGTYKIGSAALKVTRGTADAGATLTSRITVYPGVRYYFGAWVHAGTSSGALLHLTWYDSSGSSISTSSTSPASSTLAGWAWLASTASAPPAAATVDVTLSAQTSGHAFFDAITLQPCVPVVESPYTEPASTGSYASGAVSYSVNGDAFALGDVCVYDMNAQTDGTLSASSYTRVYGERHNFSGDVLLDNGIVRVWLKRGYAGQSPIRLSAYCDGSWQAFVTAGLDIGGTGSATVSRVQLQEVSARAAQVRVILSDDNEAVFTIRRGSHAVKVKTTRVADAGGSEMDFQLGSTNRFVVYNASSVLRDSSLQSTQSIAGTSLTEPFALHTGASLGYWSGLGFTNKPTTLYADSGTGQQALWRLTSASTSALERTFWFVFVPWPWLLNGYYVQEAESATMASGAASAADATASGSSVASLDANGETVDYSFVAARDLPLGHYTLVIRAKDSAAVASDCTMSVYNTTDASSIASQAKTLTTSYAFYTLDFELASSASADSIRVRAAKSTATANTISVDYFLIVPRKRNSATPSHVWFPYDVARNALMDTTQRESVRRG